MEDKKNIEISFVILFGIVLLPCKSLAYVGPGAGITALGAMWAVIAAVVVTIIGIIWWPLRGLIRRLKAMISRKKNMETAQQSIKQPKDTV